MTRTLPYLARPNIWVNNGNCDCGQGGAKVVVSQWIRAGAPWKSQLRGLNEMENAIPNYASVWGYPVRPGYPGHPFPHPYLYICVYFPARHLGWAVIAAIVGSQPPQPQDEGYGIEDEGRRTKDDFVFLPRLPHSRSSCTSCAKQPSRPLFICVYNTTKSATLSLPYPLNMWRHIFLPVPQTGLLGFRLWLWLCHVDVMFTFMDYCFRMSWVLLWKVPHNHACIFYFIYIYFMYSSALTWRDF